MKRLLLMCAALLAAPILHAKPAYGLQLYSLREQTKTDVPGALDLVEKWGIVEVETAGTGGCRWRSSRSCSMRGSSSP